ncbi:hypothetical protein L9F63_005351, partial [Diploptera punctata]
MCECDRSVPYLPSIAYLSWTALCNVNYNEMRGAHKKEGWGVMGGQYDVRKEVMGDEGVSFNGQEIIKKTLQGHQMKNAKLKKLQPQRHFTLRYSKLARKPDTHPTFTNRSTILNVVPII